MSDEAVAYDLHLKLDKSARESERDLAYKRRDLLFSIKQALWLTFPYTIKFVTRAVTR